MRASASMAREAFARLARRIAEIEGRPALPETPGDGPRTDAGPRPRPALRPLLSPRRGGALLPLGLDGVDGMLGGGLRRDALHEIRAGTTREGTAASGFAIALLALLAARDDRPFLFVLEEAAAREGGHPYGPGLVRLGLDPRRLVLVVTRRPEETLWALEEGLRCTGLAAVLGEFRGHPRALDLTASRRLALRARESGVMGLLLRQGATAEPTAARTRWHVRPWPAGTLDDFAAGIGRPAWRLDLERNRAGRTGGLVLEWDHGASRFVLPDRHRAALPVGGPAVPLDRPDPADPAGTVVALPRAG